MRYTELAPQPTTGRVYRETVRTGIADVAPSGRARLDAIARWLQDAAYFDLVDAGWERPDPWIVRRLRLRVHHFPAHAEALTLMTWCSGLGPAVAERRTTLRGACGAHVEAVAQWVAIDPVRRRPAPLPERFLAVYAPSASGRRSRTKLHHPSAPPAGAAQRSFAFRAADVDLAEHVNNAAYWAVLEEELAAHDAATPLDAEVEHRTGTAPGPVAVHTDTAGGGRWVVAPDGAVAATFLVGGPAPAAR